MLITNKNTKAINFINNIKAIIDSIIIPSILNILFILLVLCCKYR